MIFEKTDIPDILRDKTSNALINTNNDALNAYKAKKQHMIQLLNTTEKVNKLESEMAEIKQLLQKIVEKI